MQFSHNIYFPTTKQATMQIPSITYSPLTDKKMLLKIYQIYINIYVVE